MFFDTSPQEVFVIDRVSSAKKILRRVLILSDDGSVSVCKPHGLVTRLFHVNQISHLVYATENGARGGLVLLRVNREHDLLFTHATQAEGGNAYPMRLIDKIESLRQTAFGSTPINVVEREDPQLLRGAANLEKSAAFSKPASSVISNQVLVPILFDDFAIPQAAELGVISEETDIFVDASFVTMITRAIEMHPLTAHQQPCVHVEAPPPFSSVEVSAKFLSGFCRAYERELPLVMTLHSHLPTITTFRASKRFWDFMQRLLRVSRPTSNVLATLSDAHIEICPISDQAHPVSATLMEWNDAIVQWELSVRAPLMDKKKKGRKDTSDIFWRSFVSELEKISVSEGAGGAAWSA